MPELPADPARRVFRIATRGSALALAQAKATREALMERFPRHSFELQVIKTTGDRLPDASLSNPDSTLPRGLFTKELELALLAREADIAVHSLKDLPTEIPAGLILAATPIRQDVREVLIYRGLVARSADSGVTGEEWRPGQREPLFGPPGLTLAKLPPGAVIATSSTRRAAAVGIERPDCKLVPLRGNVGTRLQKLGASRDLDATLLAAAGLLRLNFDWSPQGELRIDPRLSASRRAEVSPPPAGLFATLLEPDEFLPAVGQGALGLEVRADDAETAELVRELNHANTFAAVTAERALLAAMGGGCQTPVAAYARVLGHQLRLAAAWYHQGIRRRAIGSRPVREAAELGRELALRLLAFEP